MTDRIMLHARADENTISDPHIRHKLGKDLTAHIIFTEDSFDKPYPLLSRTYSVSSDNKAFWSRMGGRSIFAYCLEPVAGNQTACGEWTDLPIDRVHGYCTLLERHVNGRAGA